MSLADAIEAAAPRLTVALWNLAHGRGHAGNGPQIDPAARTGAGEIDGKHAPSGHATADDRDDRQEQ